jgi:pheromone shutdown protein TraB
MMDMSDMNSTTFKHSAQEKENVKKIMAALQKTAPEIYEAMVAERDVYMGKGLDELDENLKSDVGDTVAVMGMAHVDGVERYLLSRGWEMRSYPCKVVR